MAMADAGQVCRFAGCRINRGPAEFPMRSLLSSDCAKRSISPSMRVLVRVSPREARGHEGMESDLDAKDGLSVPHPQTWRAGAIIPAAHAIIIDAARGRTGY